MSELKLKQPITLSTGKQINTLTCNYDALTTADFRAAQKIRALITDAKSIDASRLMSVLRMDPEFQIAVGFVAACKGTPDLTQLDFLKLSMYDAMMLGEGASDYFFE